MSRSSEIIGETSQPATEMPHPMPVMLAAGSIRSIQFWGRKTEEGDRQLQVILGTYKKGMPLRNCILVGNDSVLESQIRHTSGNFLALLETRKSKVFVLVAQIDSMLVKEQFSSFWIELESVKSKQL